MWDMRCDRKLIFLCETLNFLSAFLLYKAVRQNNKTSFMMSTLHRPLELIPSIRDIAHRNVTIMLLLLLSTSPHVLFVLLL